MPVGSAGHAVPAKITSSMRYAAQTPWQTCSPSTQEMESEMFDFPPPVGAHTAQCLSPGKLDSVVTEGLESKDLQLLEFSQLPTPSGMANGRTTAAGRCVFSFRGYALE